MRKVVVFNMGDNTRQQIDTNAVTWGEVLQASSSIRSMVAPDMQIVIKQTKTTIQSEQAVLPDGDVMIYLTPGKVKSGKAKKGASYKTKLTKQIQPLVEARLDAYTADLKSLVEEVKQKK